MHVLAQATASWLADPLVLLAIGVGVLLVIYLYVRRRGQVPPSAHAAVTYTPNERASATGSADGEAAAHPARALLRELEHAADRASAKLDERMARLEALIREADAKLAALNAAVARAKSEKITERLASGAVGTEMSGLAALSRHSEIYALADGGNSAPEIAQKLGRPSGEVELILALRGTGA